MRLLTKILIGVGGLVVLLAALAFGGWYFFLKSDPKPPAAITKTTTVGGGTLDGTYRAASGDPQSFVGYRVQEQLAAVGIEGTATGRPGQGTGRFRVNGRAGEACTGDANL